VAERYELAQQLAQRLAEAALRRADIDPSPVIPAELLAKRMRVEVRYTVMEEDGRLCPHAQPVTVLLRRDRPQSRSRFTLCHELAHELLRSGWAGAELTEAAHQASVADEEYLCDKIAGALLMPREWMDGFRSESRTLATVDRVAEQAFVSRSAALVRLRDTLGWQQALFQWKRHRGRWVLAGEAGLYPRQIGLLRTTEGTRMQLMKASAGQYDAATDVLPVQFGADDVYLRAEISADGESALALARVPYPTCPTQPARPRAWQGPGRQTARSMA
jgi:Zn-dependent peptidase ImmA (M78 family)